ncbi:MULTISPECIES: glycosyltransferase family 2 protein [Stenotrophomonas maltophilia group]|uniref:Glycosyltransferase 2-like domain-containing protein n=1 Tax=Stenotrophomonas maltophilia TaxID=40324 RepID=A0A246I7H8_STEMA|nr:glycosyltransferase family 2 protein [Stenotrophomonas maltophilia]OWQ74883.1 hypothetical protein CEE63_09300 [Stenotrophomonas maltophilia]
MHVIVIQLACWRVGGERAALARARLRAMPAASVLIVGEGAPPADLLEECAERRTLCVNSPLHAMQGRRLPDVRRSGDAEQLGWSLAVMAALRALQQDVHLDCVEIPSCGALAYALLQERALSEVFDTTRVMLRFDGIQAIEVLRQGRNVEMAALMLMDMERMCLEQCDQVLVDSQAIAESLQRFLPGSQRPLHLQATLLETAGLVSEQHAVGSALACVATEAPALRQCLRAISGYLQQSNDGLLQVSVVCQPALLSEVLHVVPAALRHRFQEAPADCLRASPMRVVMPDRWSAGSALARELLAHGHSLIVDVANPALAAAQGWEQGRTHLGYTDARGLFEALRASQQWVPTRHLRMGPSPPLPKLDVGTPGPAKVSVVVPCYNMGRWLPQTLCNIQQFSWSDLEVIVVDDGSTDPGTVQLIEELEASPTAGLRVVRLEFNQGLSAARNAGVAAAQGEFTLCLDADDLVSPEFVSIAVRALQRHPAHDFVVPRCAYFFGDESALDVNELRLGQGLPMVGAAFDSGALGNRFSTATSLARTSVLRALGYDESLRSYEDWQLYRRALQQGSRFVVTNDVHFFYRQRPDSMIHDPAMRARHSLLYAEMVGGATLIGQGPVVSPNLLGALAAPPRIDGSSSGLLLGGVVEALDEMQALRRSRIVGLGYRLSALLRWLRR